MADIAKAYVQIVPSMEGARSAITSELSGAGEEAGSSSGESFGSSFKSILTKIGIGAAVVSTIKSAFSEGAALEQSIGGVETLFGDSAEKVIENANNAFQTAGLSANEYMETVTSFSASLLQSLEGDTDAAAEAADMALTDMSDNANKFGTSMESIQNAYQGFAKQNYTMLDNLKLGYGGTKTEMERLLADAEEISGVEYDIDSLSDVYEAIHVIQTEMGVTGTTAEESASTLSGSFATMSAAWDNLLATATTGGDMSEATSSLVDSIGSMLNNALPALGNIVLGLIQGLGSFILTGLPELITQVVEWFNASFPTLISSLTELLLQLGEQLSDPSTLTSMITLGTSMIMTIITGLSEALPTLIAQMPTMINGLVTGIIENLPLLIESGLQIILAIAEGVATAFVTFLASIPDLISQLKETFTSTDWGEIGKNIVDGVKNGVMQWWENLKSTISELASGLISTVKGVLGISSPSKRFREIGEYMMSGLTLGIENGEDKVRSTLQGVANASIGAMSADVSVAGSGTSASRSGITNNIYTMSMDEGQQQRLMLMMNRQLGVLV